MDNYWKRVENVRIEGGGEIEGMEKGGYVYVMRIPYPTDGYIRGDQIQDWPRAVEETKDN